MLAIFVRVTVERESLVEGGEKEAGGRESEEE